MDNSGAAVIKRLVFHVNGYGKNITMDNWSTSYGLAVDLLKNYRLTLVCTLTKNKAKVFSHFFLPQEADLNTQACLVSRWMLH